MRIIFYVRSIVRRGYSEIHAASFAAYEVGLRRPRVPDGKSVSCVVGSESEALDIALRYF